MKKTWKIGECCEGGIISVDINEATIVVYLKEWDFSKGSNKGSLQSNAQVLERVDFLKDEVTANHLFETLTNWTTPYYADKVVEWIRENINKG